MSPGVAGPDPAGSPLEAPDLDLLRSLPFEALQRAWDSSPALVAVTTGPEHRLTYQNLTSQQLFGALPLGVPMLDMLPEMDGRPLDRVLDEGDVVRVTSRTVAIRDLDGGERVMSYVLAPLGEPATGVVMTAVDVTGETRAQLQAARSQLLVDITNGVISADEPAAGLQALTDALVPAVADVAAVFVVPEEHPSAGAPLPPEVITVSEALAGLGPPPQSSEAAGPSPWEPMLRAGRSVLIPVDANTLPLMAPDRANAAWLTAAGASSIAVVPLVVAGDLTGAIVLAATGDRHPYREADLPFFEDVAARAAAAIAQLRTARQSYDAAIDLQRALLPVAPPELTGLTAAARYVAGAPDVEVGGDWWDVHDLGGGRVALGIGDVSGRGLPAAAVMGQARAVMRAGGHAQLAPVDVLTLLDAQLCDVLGNPEDRPTPATSRAPVRFATASYAIVDLPTMQLRLANAGHLPVLLRDASGAIRRVAAPPASPLGLGIGGFVEVAEPLAPDDTLVLFTDGLVESRTQDIDDGLAMLSEAFGSCGGHDDLGVVADALLAAMERRHGHGDDDVALLVVRVEEPADPSA